MTALADTVLSPRAETSSRENENHGAEPQPGSARRVSFLPGAIKQLFRDVKNAVTGRKEDEPDPEGKRKRREETGRAFRINARKLVRRAVRIPAEAYARATAYLADTLDWLNLWHPSCEDFTEDVQPAPRDHLYPHL